jgi:hypothetical protein
MTRLQETATTAIVAAAFVLIVGPRSPAAQVSPTSAADTKPCKLMPTPDLEAAYGGKVTNPHGLDGDSSVCTVNIGGLAIRLQSAAPGTTGVPTSIQQGLVGARMMLGAAKQSAATKTRDFEKLGCLNLKMTKGFNGKALARPLLTTSCFLVEGGYLNMSVSGENAKQVRFDVVKALLEKAAARRKEPRSCHPAKAPVAVTGSDP